ncbi:restriction endonuclease subunit S [Shewanella frigidimarina]|uniref:restriction endonuclease subunit S n=1 Tax=Shewanella frigidimarina TaxID=56812 RepID=UPI003D7A93D8
MSQAINQVIPEGYKQTDIGVIPDDWVVAALNDVCNFGGGTTPPRAQHDRYFVNGTNNWIKTTDLNNSLIDFSEELITELALSEAGLKKHPVGSILVAMYGGFNQIGRTGYITRPSAINQALVAVKPNRKSLHSYYLLSELNYNVDYWKGVASSSRKDPNITSNDVKNYRIALPPIKEQAAIANALSDMDALLSELEKLIIKKQAIKTATMQQLLTGKPRSFQFVRYSDDAPEGKSKGQLKGTKPSELGEIPEDWNIVLLRDVFNFKNGLNKEKEFFGYGTPIVNYMDVYNFNGIRANSVNGLVHVTPLERKNYSAKKGDVFFTRTSETTDEIGLASVLLEDINDAVFSGFVLRARQKKQIFENGYMKYCFRSSLVRKQIQSTASYTTRALTNGQLLSNVLVLLPEPEEQTAIATILSDMDNEIQTLEQRLSKTRQIKQGMMQELLTGKTRLPFARLAGESDAD